MRLALLACVLVVSACRSPRSQDDPSQPAGTRPDTGLREPYTRTFEIEVAGEPVGYLVSYEEVPLHAQDQVVRRLPTGSHRILSPDFLDVGFLTPGGDVRRYTGTGSSVSMGVRADVREGLSLFYDGRRPVVLKPLSRSRELRVH